MQAHHIKSLQLVHDFKRKHILIGLNFSLFPLPNSSNTWGVKQHEISPDFRWNCNPSNAWKYLEKGPSSLQEPEQCRGNGIQQHRHTQSLAWEKLLVLIQWKCPNTRWCADLLKRGRRGGEEMMGEEGGRGVHPSSLPTCTVRPPLLGWASEPDRLRSEPAEPNRGHWPGAGPPLGSPCRASLSSRARFSWIRVLISSWNLHICSWSSLMRFTTHCEGRSRPGGRKWRAAD